MIVQCIMGMIRHVSKKIKFNAYPLNSNPSKISWYTVYNVLYMYMYMYIVHVCKNMFVANTSTGWCEGVMCMSVHKLVLECDYKQAAYVCY